MSTETAKNVGTCPECGADVRFKKPPLLGQMITCRRCHAQLEVVRRTPIALEWVDDDALYEQWDPNSATRSRQKTRRKKVIQFQEDDF